MQFVNLKNLWGKINLKIKNKDLLKKPIRIFLSASLYKKDTAIKKGKQQYLY